MMEIKDVQKNGEDDLRVMENGMSVPVSGLTADFLRVGHR